MEGSDERHVVELDYTAATEYRAIVEGGYEIALELVGEGDDAVVTSSRLDVAPGGAYTIAVTGLVLDEPADDRSAGDGLLSWIRGLFTPDRPELHPARAAGGARAAGRRGRAEAR